MCRIFGIMGKRANKYKLTTGKDASRAQTWILHASNIFSSCCFHIIFSKTNDFSCFDTGRRSKYREVSYYSLGLIAKGL
jgi:hypothetical protein